MSNFGNPTIDVHICFHDKDNLRGTFQIIGYSCGWYRCEPRRGKLIKKNSSEYPDVVRSDRSIVLEHVRVNVQYAYSAKSKCVLHLDKSDFGFHKIESDSDMWMEIHELLRCMGIIGLGDDYSFTSRIKKMANRVVPNVCQKFKIPQMGTFEEFQMDML